MKGLDWAILPEFVVITVSEAVQVILLVLLNLKDLWALSIVKWTLSLSCASPNIGWSFSAGVIIVICIFQKFFREVVLVFLFLSLCMKHNFIQFASFMFLRFRFTSLIIIIWRWLRTKWWSWWWAWWGCPWVTWTFPLAPLMLLLWLLFLLWFWISYILLTWRVVLVVWKTLIRSFPFPLILIFGATLASNFLILTILAHKFDNSKFDLLVIRQNKLKEEVHHDWAWNVANFGVTEIAFSQPDRLKELSIDRLTLLRNKIVKILL